MSSSNRRTNRSRSRGRASATTSSRSPTRGNNNRRSTSASTSTSNSTTSNNDKNIIDKRPGAYAVTQTTSGPAQVLRVQVPSGVRPGSEFVVHPNLRNTAGSSSSRTVRVRCPITSGPGKTLQITIPPEPVTERQRLTSARLTAALGKGQGGAKTMTPEIVAANEKRLEKYHQLQAQYAVQIGKPTGSSDNNDKLEQLNEEAQEGSEKDNLLEKDEDDKFEEAKESIDEEDEKNNKLNSQNTQTNNSPNQPSYSQEETKEEEKSPIENDDSDGNINSLPNNSHSQLQNSANSFNSVDSFNRDMSHNSQTDNDAQTSPTPPINHNNNSKQVPTPSLHKQASSSSTPTTKSTPKAFLVTIPPNIHPGMPFTIDVQGKRYVINCPPDAGPGKKIKIVPPRSRANSLSGSNNQANTNNSKKGNRPRANSTPSSSQQQRRPRSDSTDDMMTNLDDETQTNRNTSNDDSNHEQQQPQDHSESSHVSGNSTNTTTINSMNQNSNNMTQQQQAKLQMFEVRVPAGVEPGQPFALLANGQRVLVTCPPNVQVGQKIRFNLPVTAQMVRNIQLQYDNDKGSASGWCRTIRVSDLKFQWVRVTKQQKEDGTTSFQMEEPTSSTTTQSQKMNRRASWNFEQSRRLLDNKAMNNFDFSKSAYGRHLTLLKGNDARLRTGILSWVPAKDATVDSKLVLHQKVLLSYADIASIQEKPFADKLKWFEESLSKLLLIPWEEGHVKLQLRRTRLLEDSVDAIMSLSRTQLRQRWRLEFQNELAVDAGGVTREWFQLITQQVFDPAFGLWMSSANNQACSTINPVSDVSCPNDHLIYFRFLGRIMGRALLDRQLIHGHLVRSLYKHILGWPITFDDLKAQDEEYYNSLKALTEMDEDTLEALCLDFTVTEELFGARQVVELVPDGADIEVTKSNLVDYLEANLRYQMLERTRLQLTELLLGFFDVVPEPVLTVFDSHELELILCGLPTIDMDDWASHTKYAGRFKERGDQHVVVKWFWEIVRDEFNAEMKARLLQFVTGTSGVPSRGFAVLQGNDGNIKKFCLQGIDSGDHDYPRAHTCFNRLDLPVYPNKGTLRSRLKTAITLSAVGFDMN